MSGPPGTRFAAVGRPDRAFGRSFVLDYLMTMRPYLAFVSGVTGIVGLSLGPALPAGRTLLASAAFLLSYGFGQALTDCFQIDTDSLSAPYRPLVRGRLKRAHVLRVSLAGLAGCGLVFIVLNPRNAPLVVLAIAGLATYTFWKRRWWAGPPYNAAIVALLLLLGLGCATGSGPIPGERPAALGGALAACFFGYSNFVLAGYHKDVSADRATGYLTLPVRFGTRPSAVVSDALALLSVGGCGLAVVSLAKGGAASALWGFASVPALLFLSGGLFAVAVGQLRLHRVTREEEAYRAIVPVVHAYVLLLAGVALLHRPAWAPALGLFYIAFVATLARRPDEAQV